MLQFPFRVGCLVKSEYADRCGGNCTCGTCAVLMSPALSDQTLMTAKESGLLRRRGKGKG